MTRPFPASRVPSSRIALLAAAVLAAGASTAEADPGVFSSATFDTGANVMTDFNIGVSTSKTYNAIANVIGGDVIINGVTFTGSGDTLSGAGWALTGAPNEFSGGGSKGGTSGNVGNLFDGFQYGGSPTTFTLNNLTAGQAYVLTFYNQTWDNDDRTQFITSTSGATALFNEDPGPLGAGNLGRYTFVASGTTETLTASPTNAGYTFHVYGFSNEQVFTNTWQTGSDWTTATWSGGVPNAAGTNASLPSQATPTTINLDQGITVGHIQFAGTNSWTLSSATNQPLTLQADPGGVSVLNTPNGSHTISANVLLATSAGKFGSGTLQINGSISGSGGLNAQGGTLVLGSNSNTYTGTTRIAGGILKLASTTPLSIPNSGFETPPFGTFNWAYNPDPNANPGQSWTFDAQSGIAASFSPWITAAPEGNQAAFLQQTGIFSQPITVAADGQYKITFKAASRPGYNPTGVLVQIDGSTVASFDAASEIGNTNGGFHLMTANGVPLTAGTHTLSFVGNNTLSGDVATGIDSVRIYQPRGSLPIGTTLNITAGGTLDLGGNIASVGQVNNGGQGNGIVGNVTNGTLDIQNNNMFLESGTITADLTSTPGSNGRLWIGGDPSATVNLGGFNGIMYSDHHSTIIGYPITGPAGIVKLISSGALGPTSEEAQVFSGTLDLNGQTGVTAGALRLFGSSNAVVTNTSASPASMFSTVILNDGVSVITGQGDISVGALSGGGNLDKTGNNRLTVAGSSDHSGTITVDGGVLAVSGSIGATAKVIVNPGARVELAATNASYQVPYQITGGSVLITGGIHQHFGDLTLNGATISAAAGATAYDSQGNYALDGNVTVTGATPSTLASDRGIHLNGPSDGMGGVTANPTFTVDAGSTLNVTTGFRNAQLTTTQTSGFVKAGAGTMVLMGTSTYNGATKISGGTLELFGDSQFHPIPATGLTAYYTLNGDATDSSGHGNNGVPNNGPTYTPGVFGQAISLNGTQDITVANSPSLQLAGSFTVSAWFNLNSNGINNSANGILGTRFGQDTTFDVKVNGPGQQIHGDVGNGGNWINTGLDMNGLSFGAGEWHMVTYVITPTGGQLFFDGVGRADYSWGANNPTLMTHTAGAELHIGQSYPGEFMSGVIDDVLVYGTALSGQEVADLYAEGFGVLPTTTPVTVSAGATFNVGDTNQMIGSLAGEAGSTVVSDIGTLRVNQSVNTNFAGTMIVGQTSDVMIFSGGRLVKSNTGMLELSGALVLKPGTSIAVTGGKLKINVNSGTPSVGSGVTASITNDAVLELAGSVSALGTSVPAARVDITNNSTTAAGLLVSGGNQQVGGIDGSGNIEVDAAASLTANHIVAGALAIGGDGMKPATVTIAASDASGNPQAEAGGLALAGAVNSTRPINLCAIGLPSGFAGNLSWGGLGSTVGGTLGSAPAVPESSAALIAIVGAAALLAARRK